MEAGARACYSVRVPVRLTALLAACVLVLAIGVYLFIQVRASPAIADSGHRGHHDKMSAADEEPETTPPESSDSAPTPSPGHRSATVGITRPSLASGEAGGSADVAVADLNVRHATVGPHPSDHVATPKLDARMLEASKAYDRGDTAEAADIAKKILAEQPGNARMLRIVVSTACMDGDAATAKQYYATLGKSDQGQMRTRCERYGVTFDGAGAP